jgi:hypothetical protein
VSGAPGETWKRLSMALAKGYASRPARGPEPEGAAPLDPQANPHLGQGLPLCHRPLANAAVGPGVRGPGTRRDLGGDPFRAGKRTPRATGGTLAGPGAAPGPTPA